MKKYKIYRVVDENKSWLNIIYTSDGTEELIESYHGEVKDGYVYDETINVENNLKDATEDEIRLFNSLLVPISITRMALKIELLKKKIEIADVVSTIESIPNSMFPDLQKKIAIIKFNEATYFDRYNADLQLVATLIGLSQTDLDEIFINGNNN